eukprot:TRINITY_DN25919_c0_g1_i1.p1 TRINITY_DN25919_c0_g1~~TRINITY_DN25919_c0_g1_i1.p1  ORF type:complete len:536 (+),score=81.11 TRINITY_DN25919_c0_g1_i1:39-1646(+)
MQTNSDNALPGGGQKADPPRLPPLQTSKLPMKVVRPEIRFAKDDDLRCIVVCMRLTSKGRRVKRVVLINSRNLYVTDEDGYCRRNIYCRTVEKAFTNVEGTKTLLLKVKGEEDLLLQEIPSENNKNSNFASILDVLDKVREANGGTPVPRTRGCNTGRDVVANSSKGDRTKKDRPSIRTQLEVAKQRAQEDLREAQESAKIRQIARGSRPASALSSPRAPKSPLQFGIKPPPPPGMPPELRRNSSGGQLSQSMNAPPSSPGDIRGDMLSPHGHPDDLKKLTSYIEQLQAERELVDMQLDARKRELSTLTEYSQRMQDQLAQQQENAIAQQNQFNEYIRSAQKQYQEYIEALYMQHKRASEQRQEFQEMYERQNNELWKQIAAQVIEDDDGSDEDLGLYSPSSSPQHRGPSHKITIKMHDGDEVCSFSVAAPFWDELCSQIETVVGFSEHPLCSVGRGNDNPLMINKNYFVYFASAWCQRETYCVSTWQDGSWDFTDAREYWNRQAAASVTGAEPPPLDYVSQRRSSKSPKYRGRY